MFCSNCGEEIKDPNQGFCPSCGTKIGTISEAPQLETERSPYESQSTPAYSDFAVSQQKPVQRPVQRPVQMPVQKPEIVGGSIPHSIICFIFSLISLFLPLFTFIFGFNLFVSSTLGPVPPTFQRLLFNTTLIIVLHIVGLVFAIVSRAQSGKAGRTERENGLEKVGSVFAIFGIIINAILLGLIALAIPLIFLGYIGSYSSIFF